MKSSYAQIQVRQFLTATMLFLAVATISQFSFAGDRTGNGGSGDESSLAAQQAQLESVSLKIKNFFIKNRKTLKGVFPEVNISLLIEKIDSAEISAVDKDKLIDKDGINRTCLNFSQTNLIECKAKEIAKLAGNPVALFVLVFHEYLSLMGIEETTPKNPTFIEGYSISKRLAPYVTKVSDYDLQINSKTNSDCTMVVTKDIDPRIAQVLTEKGYNLTTRKIQKGDYIYNHEYAVSRAGILIDFAHGSVSLQRMDEVLVTLKAVEYSHAEDASHHTRFSKTLRATKKLPECKRE